MALLRMVVEVPDEYAPRGATAPGGEIEGAG
jgi:hypothetical protein